MFKKKNNKSSIEEVEISTVKKSNKKSNSVLPFMNRAHRTNDGEPLPKSAQDTLPYRNVFKSGIIESKPNFYTRAYHLQDINFAVAPQEDQEVIFENYCQMLNSFDASTKIQIVINNRNADESVLLKSVMSDMKGDGLDAYRIELNDMLKVKMSEGRNNIVSDKYLVVGSQYESYIEALNGLSRLDVEINQKIKIIAQNQNINTYPQTINSRLKVLHDINNIGHESNFPLDLDLDVISKQGITTKDVVSAPGYKFDIDSFRIGDKYARALFIKTLPSSLSTDFMRSVAELPFNLTASFYFEPVDTEEATKKVNRKLQNLRRNVVEAQMKASKKGYSTDLISPDLQHSQEQAEYLLEDMRDRDQKIFIFTGVIVHYADTKEELDKDTASIRSMANRYIITIDKLIFQQEQGFKSVLPLCRNDFPSGENKFRRMLPTENAGLFIPFSSKELIQDRGMYYGLNAVSKNLILYNRLTAKNQNGLILGQSGSGKSFSAKREMVNVFLNTNDELYILDPESEYTYMAEVFGGSVIKLEAGSKVYINPLDMDINYGSSDDGCGDPVTLKSDYVVMLCETIMGGKSSGNQIYKSIIDRCVTELYKPYMRHMRELDDTTITCDTTASPTLNDLYEKLASQPEPEALNIALALEIYCRGTLDTFAHRTNVDVNNRLTVYDISKIGSSMKELGLQVCLNHIWNAIIKNKALHKRTWFYIDEFHVLTKSKSSAEFLEQIWKRARKWGGVPTAITQNVKDMFANDAALSIIQNCEFILMLSQDPVSRDALANMYKISSAQLNYITNSPPGQGLIYNGDSIIPFIDHFPKNTKLYTIMSTSPQDRKVS